MPLSEKVLKRSKMCAEPLRFDAAAGVAHGELHKVLDLFGGQKDFAVVGRVKRIALDSRLSRMERTARRSAWTRDRSA